RFSRQRLKLLGPVPFGVFKEWHVILISPKPADCNPGPKALSIGSPKAYQRDIVMLTLAGSVDLHLLDDAVAQSPRREISPLDGRVYPLDLKLNVVDVHGVGDAVAEDHQAVAWLQLDLARRVFKSIDH